MVNPDCVIVLHDNIHDVVSDRSYPSGNSMVISICTPLRLNHDQM